MAYEISEGAAAAAVLLKSTELEIEKVNSIDKLITAMGVLHKNLDNVVMSDSERIQYKAWFNVDDLDKEIANKNKDAKLTAVLHGYSAARGIKEWFKASQTVGGGGERCWLLDASPCLTSVGMVFDVSPYFPMRKMRFSARYAVIIR